MKKSIQSKVFVPVSKKETVLKIAVYLSVAVVALTNMISIISSGAKIGNVSPIIIAATVGVMVRRRFNTQSRYAFCVAETTLSDDVLTIDYLGQNQKVQFNLHELKELQYSDELQCLRLFGNFAKTEHGITTYLRDEEHLFYVKEAENEDFMQQLVENARRCVTYMDRESE